jgi:hypothetical protein
MACPHLPPPESGAQAKPRVDHDQRPHIGPLSAAHRFRERLKQDIIALIANYLDV